MAPALLFFAITGGLQTFGLHETSRGSSYTPPTWLATLAMLHKKQTTIAPLRKTRALVNSAPAADLSTATVPVTASRVDVLPVARPLSPSTLASGYEGAPPKKNLLPMKLFFALVALSLCLSTLTGLYMAYRYSRKPVLVGGLLIAGVLVPLLLWLF